MKLWAVHNLTHNLRRLMTMHRLAAEC